MSLRRRDRSPLEQSRPARPAQFCGNGHSSRSSDSSKESAISGSDDTALCSTDMVPEQLPRGSLKPRIVAATDVLAVVAVDAVALSGLSMPFHSRSASYQRPVIRPVVIESRFRLSAVRKMEVGCEGAVQLLRVPDALDEPLECNLRSETGSLADGDAAAREL
eukprot:CAMPEP_0170578358 /NCGR_PEP_ID=MMETSP0224-20130122/5411_1 /TAXON_ID=285029 /ORGANISM="Togula jolla, Strain CCCM 725" /LENGTH=162 /DNA_ID=CAMNT_0010901317 /DNA_START=351 /DNA_END=839 /DNA_ORIENTATION=+